MSTEKDDGEKLPTRVAQHFFQFGADLGMGVQLSINGSIYEGDNDQEIFSTMDRIRRIIDRERAKHELQKFLEEIEKIETNAKIAIDEIERIEGKNAERRTRGKNLDNADVARLGQMKNNIEVFKKNIEKLREMIAVRKRLIAGLPAEVPEDVKVQKLRKA